MSIKFSEIGGEPKQVHFRVLEKDGKMVKRTFKPNNEFTDQDLEEDPWLNEFILGFNDLPF